MLRLQFRHLVRFPLFSAELLHDRLDPQCVECEKPAVTMDLKYREWVCADHEKERKETVDG
jgi:hypothetical protein